MYTTLAEVEIEDLARFLSIFATDGRAKREEYGSRGAEVLSTADGSDRVIVLIDWQDEGGLQALCVRSVGAADDGPRRSKGAPALHPRDQSRPVRSLSWAPRPAGIGEVEVVDIPG